MIALDASVVIAHLDSSDRRHHEATAILLDDLDLLIHPLTLAEVLLGGARDGHAAAMRDDLLAAGLRVVEVDPDQALRLAELRIRTRLKMPDCCVLDVAERHRARLASFDAALISAAAARGVEVVDAPDPSPS